MKYISFFLCFILQGNFIFCQNFLYILNADKNHPRIEESFFISDRVYYLLDTDKERKTSKKDSTHAYFYKKTGYRAGSIKNILDSVIIIKEDTIPLKKITYIGDLKGHVRSGTHTKILAAISFAVTAAAGAVLVSHRINGTGQYDILTPQVFAYGALGSAVTSFLLIRNRLNGYDMRNKNLSFRVTPLTK